MGNSCFVCGLDYRVVKLKQMQIVGDKGKLQTETVCDHCERIVLDGNHISNQNLSEPENLGGFVKPGDGGAYPAVRPV